MKTYIVTDQPVSIGPGATLKLTATQLAPRLHNVTVLEKTDGKAVVTVNNALQFKVGETFQLDGDPSKGLLEVISDVEKLKPDEIAAIKQKAKNPRPAKPAAAKPKGSRRG